MARQYPKLAAYMSIFFYLTFSAALLHAQNPQQGATAARDATRRGRSTTQRHAPPTAFASLNKPTSFSLPPVVIYYSRDGAEVPNRKSPNVEKRTDGIGESITILYGGNKSASTPPRPVPLARNTAKPLPQTSAPSGYNSTNAARPTASTVDPQRTSYAPELKPSTTAESRPPSDPVDSEVTNPKPPETDLAGAAKPIPVSEEIAKGVSNPASDPPSAKIVAPPSVNSNGGTAAPPISDSNVDTKPAVEAAPPPPAQSSSNQTKLSTEPVPLNNPGAESKIATETVAPPAAVETATKATGTAIEPKVTTETAVAPPPVANAPVETNPVATEPSAAPTTTNPATETKLVAAADAPPTETNLTATASAPPPAAKPAVENPNAAPLVATDTKLANSNAAPVTSSVPETKPSAEAAAIPTAAAAADPVAMNNTAIQLTSESRFEEASVLLKRAIQIKPDTYKLHRNLSIVYERMNKLDQALVSAETAVKIAPAEPSAVAQLCSIQLQVAKFADSVGCYENLGKLTTLDAVAGTSYGVALLRSGKTRNAIAVLQRTVDTTAANGQTLNALGVAYFEEKRFADAVGVFKKAVELDPNQHGLRFNLAISYLSTGNKEGALSQYRILKQDDPKLAAQLYSIIFRDKVVSVDELRQK